MKKQFLYYSLSSIFFIFSAVMAFIYWQSSGQEQTSKVTSPTATKQQETSVSLPILSVPEQKIYAGIPVELPISFQYEGDASKIKDFDISLNLQTALAGFDLKDVSLKNLEGKDNLDLLVTTSNIGTDSAKQLKITATVVNELSASQFKESSQLALLSFIPELNVGETSVNKESEISSLQFSVVSSQLNLIGGKKIVISDANYNLTFNKEIDDSVSFLIIDQTKMAVGKIEKLPIYVKSKQLVQEVNVTVSYPSDILEVVDYEPSKYFDTYPLFENDVVNKTLSLQALVKGTVEADKGKTDSNILVATLVLKPKKVSTGFNLKTVSDKTKILNSKQENILTNSYLGSLAVLDSSNMALQCYQVCDYSFQCPGNAECKKTGSQSICVSLTCSSKEDNCVCPLDKATNLKTETLASKNSNLAIPQVYVGEIVNDNSSDKIDSFFNDNSKDFSLDSFKSSQTGTTNVQSVSKSLVDTSVVTPTIKITAAPTAIPSQPKLPTQVPSPVLLKPTEVQPLPQAGNQELSIFLMFISSILVGGGLFIKATRNEANLN